MALPKQRCLQFFRAGRQWRGVRKHALDVQASAKGPCNRFMAIHQLPATKGIAFGGYSRRELSAL